MYHPRRIAIASPQGGRTRAHRVILREREMAKARACHCRQGEGEGEGDTSSALSHHRGEATK